MPEREWSGDGRLFLSSPRSPNGLPEAGNLRTVRSSLRPPETAADKKRQQSTIASAVESVSAFRAQQLLAFFRSQPVSDTYSQPSNTLHATYHAARSGLRSPQSDASYASRRITASLRLIVDGAYGCCSRAIRYCVTTVLLKASRGSEQCQSMNSRLA